MHLINSILTATLIISNVAAHPGHHEMSAEIAERAAFMANSKRDLSHCAAKMKARGLDKSNIARRSALAQEARKERGISADAPFLKTRDSTSVANTTHLSPTNYTTSTPEAVLFAANNSCILSPEVTEGPYYVSGEYVRSNVTESQAGVSLLLDTQIIDMATCLPIPSVMLEIWHCNSTGVYSGVLANGNGDLNDASNINKTFLRGLQPTDTEGVAQFATLFPGHYTGRATHIHVLAHFNGTSYPNGTYSGGYVSHVGQLFFDQDLITAVEKTPVYASNTQDITANLQDTIFVQEAASSDPVVEYSLLGSDVSEGVLAWVAFGVDLTLQKNVSAAAALYEGGGVSNAGGVANAGGGFSGPGGPGANGTGNGTMDSPPM